jgi:PQQ-dependent catabolism-associated CXXCW motif protein
MRARQRFLAGMTALALAIPAHAAEEPAARPAEPALFDAEGYRSARYRSPIKADPAPATVIDLAAALALEPGRDALFIDVMPVEGGMRDPVSGVWSLTREHLTIAGALWLPETGRAPVDAGLWQALEVAIDEARAAAPDQPVILFCRADCWMSWNAARRLARLGVENVHWLAEGTDGWHAAGRRLVTAVPVAVPATGLRQSQQQQEN